MTSQPRSFNRVRESLPGRRAVEVDHDFHFALAEKISVDVRLKTLHGRNPPPAAIR